MTTVTTVAAARPARWGVPALLGLLAAGLAVVAALGPVPQDQAYHRLADARRLAGVPNALNVLSNTAFVAVGLGGLAVALGGRATFADARERWPYAAFFAALTLTGLGSAWYHLEPGDARLVWDRLPLAAAFMALFAAVLAERVAPRLGLALLAPLVAVGLGSVMWWYAGVPAGGGDLRAYGLVQFYPMVAIPVVLAACPPRYAGSGLGTAVAVYALGKVAELGDAAIFSATGLVSGHTLKHLLAAGAAGAVARMLARRQPLDAPAPAGGSAGR